MAISSVNGEGASPIANQERANLAQVKTQGQDQKNDMFLPAGIPSHKPLVVAQSWRTPFTDPFKLLPEIELKKFAEKLKLDDSKPVQAWMKRVKHYFESKQNAGEPAAIRAMRSIAQVIKDYKMEYHTAPGLLLGQGPYNLSYVQKPSRLLVSRAGNCVEASVLAVATLRRLGFDAVLMYTRFHTIVGLAAKEPRLGKLKGLPFSIKDPLSMNNKKKITYLIPVDVTFRTYDNFDSACRRGYEFAKEAKDYYSLFIVESHGNIVWRNDQPLLNFNKQQTVVRPNTFKNTK